jgi:hypothetical protein
MVIVVAYFKAHALAVPEGRPLWHVVGAGCPGSQLLCVFLTCVHNLSKPKIWLSGVLCIMKSCLFLRWRQTAPKSSLACL